MNRTDALYHLQLLKPQLLKKYPIARLGIFGSVARNEQQPESDLDVLVEFSGPVGMEFIALAEELESSLLCKVDLVSRNGIKDRYFRAIQPDLLYV